MSRTKVTFILFFPFLFFPYFCGENFANVSYLNYIFFLVFAFTLLKSTKDKTRLLLSPAYVTTLYLYICFLIGDFLFRSGIYIDYRHYDYYTSWNHQQLSNTYTNIATYLGLVSYYCCPKDGFLNLNNHFFNSAKKARLVGLVLLFVSLVSIRLLGESSIKDIIVSLACVFAILTLYSIKKSTITNLRFLLYFSVIAFFAIADPDDKRNSIFLFYVIALLEVPNLKRLKIKHVFYVSLASLFLFFAIVIMSIFRSASSASENISIKDALYLIPEYVTADASLAVIANNFEIDFVYINSFQAVEFIEDNPSHMMYGSSYLKPLFLPIPRSVYPNKPLSAMLEYTIVYDQEAADEGYCLPLSLAAEAYWNFRYGAVLIVFLYFYFLNWFYCKGINTLYKLKEKDYSNILFLFAMYLMIMLIRGAGLDIFTLQFLIGVFVIYIFRKIV